ncbi:MAG: glycosyltransferase family 2 protein [Candidatus Gastranaerophilaceae bacterium]
MRRSTEQTDNQIKVSIIMSLFNVELYMRTAIESVLNQTLKEIELICIDDGSTDYTLTVAKEYAKKDKRIKIIKYKETNGQAYARNRGITVAKGKYIGFVDGDDWVESTMFEKLYNEAEKNQTDVAFCAAALYDDQTGKTIWNNDYYNMYLIPKEFDNRVFTHEETKNLLTGSLNVALWNKIYRTDFLNKNKIRFPEHYIFEDMPFFYETWFNAKSICFIRDCCYYYRINRQTSTMSRIADKVLDRVDMVALTYDMFKKLPYYNEIKTQVTIWIIEDLFHRFTILEGRYRREFFFQMKKLFQNLDLENIDIEKLNQCYYYNEYKNCLNLKFVDFLTTLADTYIRAKKRENQLESKILSEKYKTQLIYEEIIKNMQK